MKHSGIFISTLLIAVCGAQAQKTEVRQIVEGNLNSIAATERRLQLKNLTSLAKVEYSLGPNHKDVFNGPAVIVAEGTKAALAFALPFQDYPQEKFSYDGSALRIGFARPGVRSLFGEFLHNYGEIVKGGIFGGAFRWTSGNESLASHIAKFSFEGIKKVDGREVFVISTAGRSGSGLSTRLFFEKATYRHLRTEYRRTVTVPMGSRQEVPEHVSDTRQELFEEFSDFKIEEGVTLPRTYKVRLVIETGNATREVLFVFTLRAILFNQDLDITTFNIEAIK